MPCGFLIVDLTRGSVLGLRRAGIARHSYHLAGAEVTNGGQGPPGEKINAKRFGQIVTMNGTQVYLLSTHLIKLAVVSVSVALAAGFRIRAGLVRWASFAAALLLLFYLMILFKAMIPPDYHIFWRAGRDIWSGLDPYAPARFSTNPFLNPPTALPLFALFAILPFAPSFVIWALLNLLICLALPAFSLRVLRAQGGRDSEIGHERKTSVDVLPTTQLVAMTAALAVSDAFIRGLYAGQLGLLTAFFLIAALGAQARGRPIVAGVCLALATIKVVTMLPFLLLFHRRSDITTWLSLGCVCIGLCLATGRLEALPGRLSNMAQRIEALSAPGKVNDYSFEGTQNESLIGFEHLFYCLGVRDRLLIRWLQYLAVATAGLWVAWQVLVARRPPGAACSLVALFAMVFLYHRDYDALILTLPMVYCASRAHRETGTARYLFSGCSIAIHAILYMNLTLLMFLTGKSQIWGVAGRLIQATLLPYALWLILLAMAAIVTADSLARRRNIAASPS
jgi:hypothetical protein